MAEKTVAITVVGLWDNGQAEQRYTAIYEFRFLRDGVDWRYERDALAFSASEDARPMTWRAEGWQVTDEKALSWARLPKRLKAAVREWAGDTIDGDMPIVWSDPAKGALHGTNGPVWDGGF